MITEFDKARVNYVLQQGKNLITWGTEKDLKKAIKLLNRISIHRSTKEQQGIKKDYLKEARAKLKVLKKVKKLYCK